MSWKQEYMVSGNNNNKNIYLKHPHPTFPIVGFILLFLQC